MALSGRTTGKRLLRRFESAFFLLVFEMVIQAIRGGVQSKAIKAVIFFIILSFAGFGLESMLPSGSGTSVAEVNGTEISPQELEFAVDGQKRQLIQIFGDNIDPAMLEDDRLRPRALETLIDRELLLQESERLGLSATDRAIGQIVAEVEAFQIDGQFSPEQYKVVLANAGLTPERFRRSQAQELVVSQLESAILSSDFMTPTEVSAAADVTAEERDVRYLVIDRQELLDGLQITEDVVIAYYENNGADFVTEEQAIAQYIELSAEDFFTPVDPEELEDQFEAVKSEYEVSEQARVSHILLAQRDGESKADYALRVDSVASQLAADADFAALAGEASDDIGSASLGGELGFTDGSAFPEAMEEAIAQLGIGEVSAAVETDAGIHFIRVDDRVAGESADFDTLRAELEASIQRSNAEQELLVAVDALRDLSFNAADLSGPAEALGVTVQLSSPVSRSEGLGIFSVSNVRSTLFSDEVFDAGNNSEVLELPGNRFLALRVDSKIPQTQKPFDEVAEAVRARLEAEALELRLAELLDDVRVRVQDGQTLEKIAQAEGWEWRVELAARRAGSLLPREVSELAFRMESTNGADLARVALPGDQYAIVELADVTPGSIENLSDAERSIISDQLATVKGQIGLVEYRRALRRNGDILTR